MGRKDHERAPNSPRLTTTPMLDAERKASLFCGRRIGALLSALAGAVVVAFVVAPHRHVAPADASARAISAHCAVAAGGSLASTAIRISCGLDRDRDLGVPVIVEIIGSPEATRRTPRIDPAEPNDDPMPALDL
jgi:hypothetical protein